MKLMFFERFTPLFSFKKICTKKLLSKELVRDHMAGRAARFVLDNRTALIFYDDSRHAARRRHALVETLSQRCFVAMTDGADGGHLLAANAWIEQERCTEGKGLTSKISIKPREENARTSAHSVDQRVVDEPYLLCIYRFTIIRNVEELHLINSNDGRPFEDRAELSAGCFNGDRECLSGKAETEARSNAF